MYEGIVEALRLCVKYHKAEDALANAQKAADAIEELSKRIDRAVELYNRGVERSAMYEALVGIVPECQKEEA